MSFIDFIDPVGFVLMLPALALALYAQFKVQSTFNKYLQVRARSGMTGAQVARAILNDAGLHDVPVEMIHGRLTDHYDPRSRSMRLSPDVYNGTSVASLGVAAHETGHALQHAENYIPLTLRNQLFPVAAFGSQLAMPLFFIGLIFGAPGVSGWFMNLGIWFFAAAVAFQVVTLPVEFNASSRAMRLLVDRGFIDRDEAPRTRKVLSAAALTYVAAAAVAAMQLIRLILLRNARGMKGPSPARLAAAHVLTRVETEGAFAPIAASAWFRSHPMHDRDRALATEIIYGVLRWRGRLDFYLAHFSKRSWTSLTPWMRNALRIAAYQVLFLRSVPAPVACSETVELVKVKERHAAGFANGVTRAFLRGYPSVRFPSPSGDLPGYLETWESHPRWLVERWLRAWGAEEVRALCEADNRPAGITLRVNAVRAAVPEVVKALSEVNIRCLPGNFCPNALRLEGAGAVPGIPGFSDGRFDVQDEGSQLVSWAVAPDGRGRIADLCAGPGGKTTHLAELWATRRSRVNGDQSEGPPITAVDVHEHRLRLVMKNARRLGVAELITGFVGDARSVEPGARGTFSRVLVDAPCSGTGVLRRRPDLRWQKAPEDIPALVDLQREILAQAAKLAAPGGSLTYATCSLEPEENVDNARWFLSRYPDFRPDPIRPHLPEEARTRLGPDRFLLDGSALQLFPHRDDTDGMFVFRTVRRDVENEGQG